LSDTRSQHYTPAGQPLAYRTTNEQLYSLCTSLYCTVLHCTALNCFLLHCTDTWRQHGACLASVLSTNPRRALSWLRCSDWSIRWLKIMEMMEEMMNCHVLTLSPWNDGASVIKTRTHNNSHTEGYKDCKSS
jgi:hypothetical protein